MICLNPGFRKLRTRRLLYLKFNMVRASAGSQTQRLFRSEAFAKQPPSSFGYTQPYVHTINNELYKVTLCCVLLSAVHRFISLAQGHFCYCKT
jgi:hypothetical protein